MASSSLTQDHHYPVGTDPDSSQLVKSHSGLAAAISRILCEDQQTATTASKDSTTKSADRKRGHKRAGTSSDLLCSEEEDEDPKASHHQSEIVKTCHRPMQYYSIDDEKKLRRLATRGVVQLFNAVSKHQKSIEDKLKEAGPSERKKHKILSSVDKGGFIDMLKGAHVGDLKDITAQSTEPAWSILRDDYLRNSKHQDWDQDDNASDGDGSDSD